MASAGWVKSGRPARSRSARRSSMSVHSTEVAERVDALIARMTRGGEGRAADPVLLLQPARADSTGAGSAVDVGQQPAMVEAALATGEVGSLLFVTDPAEINRLQRLAVEGNRLGIPRRCSGSTSSTACARSCRCRSRWPRPGIPTTIEQGQAVAAREARAVGIHWAFAPMVDIARDPRWGRIIEGAGEDPYLGAAVAAAQVRGFQGDGLGAPGPGHRRAEALRRLRRRARRARLRRGQPLRLRAVERLLPAVQGGGRGRRRATS